MAESSDRRLARRRWTGALAVAGLTVLALALLPAAGEGRALAGPWTLSVSVSGDGSGHVTGNGINCPGTCSVSLPDGTGVSLSASPDAGSHFSGFDGPSSFTITADTQVDAGFGLDNSGPPPPPPPPPTGAALILPADKTVEATSPQGSAITYTVTVNSTDAYTIVCQPPSGSTFPLGTTQVGCTATEPDSGAFSTGGFKVTVVDTTPPALSGLPAAQTVEAISRTGATAAYTSPSASDIVDGSVPVGCLPVSGSVFPIGKTTVVCTAVDKGGNKASASFPVTVADTKPPVFSRFAPVVVEKIKGTSAKVSYGVPTATDAVDGKVHVSCTPPPGSSFKVGTAGIVCKATDSHGNAKSARFKLRVVGTAAPMTARPGLIGPADDAHVSSPPFLRWTAVAKAAYYNVQLFLNGKKVLSIWPTFNHLKLATSWTYGGVKHTLSPGSYRWYVWPGFGTLAAAKYGSLIGTRTFVVGS